MHNKFPIVTIKPGDKKYPKLLLQITDFPKQLYCRGNLELLNKECLAVVGTRKLTPYGKEAAQNITMGLVQAGFVIVSGLALGIDAVAHQATLDAEGKTIAVLGSGINDTSIYPGANFNLAMDILKNDGLIISEYPKGTEGYKSNFPERNRIISGLSKGVLVVEADQKSGSLITARLAAEQNRDVFAVPGSIFSSRSIGPNGLIKTGAKLVSSAQDILDEYGPNLKLLDDRDNFLSTKNPVEKNIIAILEERGPMFVDDIVRTCEVETSKITAALAVLEVKGKIKNIGNGKYRKN